jgi:hypothetical protein
MSIRTPSIELEIRGDREDVEHLYEELRPVVIARFRQYLAPDSSPDSHRGEVSLAEKRSSRDDGSTREPDAETLSLPEAREGFLEVTVYRPRYTKQYLSAHSDLDGSPLTEALDLAAIRRLHLDAELAERFESRLECGRTLWRRLTSDARSCVETEHPDDS